MKISNIFLTLLFCGNAFAGETYGGGGFVVQEASFKQPQGYGPALVIGSYDPNFDREAAAYSMFESLMAYQEGKNLAVSPNLAAQIVEGVVHSKVGEPILAVFNPVQPATVGMLTEYKASYERIGIDELLKHVIEPVVSSDGEPNPSSMELLENFRIYSH